MSCRRGFHRRVAGIGESIAIGPSRLLQIESAAMTNAALVGLKKNRRNRGTVQLV
jgi:hypothetical protein